MIAPLPPRDEAELLARADALAGATVGELAGQLGVRLPDESRRTKGLVGTLLETALGATAASRAMPDFPAIGVELKSVPVDARGQPVESTYVCTAPLDGSLGRDWRSSWVRGKLARVLWVPVLAGRERPIADRVIGAPLLWSPTEADDALLGADFTELAERIARGEHYRIDARLGRALQVRPKAATRHDLVWVVDDEGQWARANPRGFYLRATFVGDVLRRSLRP